MSGQPDREPRRAPWPALARLTGYEAVLQALCFAGTQHKSVAYWVVTGVMLACYLVIAGTLVYAWNRAQQRDRC